MKRLWLRFRYWRLRRAWRRLDPSTRRAFTIMGATPEAWAEKYMGGAGDAE